MSIAVNSSSLLKALHCMLNQWQLLQVTASSDCMHKLVYLWFGTLAPASPDTGTAPFGSWRCSRLGFGRSSHLASRLWGRGRLSRGASDPIGGRSNLGRQGAGCCRRGAGVGRRDVSKLSGKAVFDDLGLWTSVGTRKFEDALVE